MIFLQCQCDSLSRDWECHCQFLLLQLHWLVRGHQTHSATFFPDSDERLSEVTSNVLKFILTSFRSLQKSVDIQQSEPWCEHKQQHQVYPHLVRGLREQEVFLGVWVRKVRRGWMSGGQVLPDGGQGLAGLSGRFWRNPLPPEVLQPPVRRAEDAESRAEICQLDVWVARPPPLRRHAPPPDEQLLQLEHQLQTGLYLSNTTRKLQTGKRTWHFLSASKHYCIEGLRSFVYKLVLDRAEPFKCSYDSFAYWSLGYLCLGY